MSLHCLPCLYFTLGGEMLIILEQRLEAQDTPVQKQKKVLREIACHFLSESALSSLFTPQPVMNKRRLKANFTKLAHSSVMKLSNDAMDKLFDLMLMALKYKVITCKSGHELLMLTLSHLDGIRQLLEDNPRNNEMVDKAISRCVQFYHQKMSPAELSLVRFTILNHLQDIHKKVSVFLTQHIQLSSGRFVFPYDGTVPFGSELPGKITYHQKDGKVETFSLPVQYCRVQKEGSYDATGDRRIVPHLNLYGVEKRERARSISDELKETEASSDSVRGNAELDLLQHLLIGFQSSSTSVQSFKLTLFDEEDPPSMPSSVESETVSKDTNTVKITNSRNLSTTEMEQIIQDFDSSTSKETVASDRGDDLLSLMDTL